MNLMSLDLWATRLLNAPAGTDPVLDSLMIVATKAGVPLMVLVVGLRWWAKHDRLRERQVAFEAGLSFLLGLLINQIVILLVARVRPYDAGVTDLIIAPSTDPSFPSDHATAAAIVAALWLNGLRQRALLFAIPALLVVVSRVYVGTHYASDVLGGFVTAWAAAAGVHATVGPRTRIDKLVTGIF